MRILLTTFIILFGALVFSSFNQETDPEKEVSAVIELEVTQKQSSNQFDKYFGYFKDILGPIVALIGIFLTLPILKKKLTENHITTKLNEIQAANSEMQAFNQRLIDKYLPLTYSDEFLSKKDIEGALLDLQKGFQISQKASSDVATLMFYLRATIYGVIKHYDAINSKSFTTRVFLGFIMDNLELVNFYSTQVVQIPKSSKTQKSDLIIKPLRKYVSHSQVVQYRHFKFGVIDDPDSAHFTMFIGKVNRTKHALLMRSAFQIYRSPNAIAKLLYANKIYAPSCLSMPHEDPLFGTKSLDLYLIGFSTSNQISSDPEAPSKVVDLIYSNPEDSHRFVAGLQEERFKSIFNDNWIQGSGFQISRSIKMTKIEIETFILKFDRKYLDEQYKRNKKQIKKKLRKTVPNN